MDCIYLGACGSCALNISYEEQKQLKTTKIKELFSKFWDGEFEFVDSDESGFRSRAEFGIWHENNDISYCMRSQQNTKLMLIMIILKLYLVMI